MRPNHYWKFRAAVVALADGTDPLRRRLLGVLHSCVSVLADDLPEEVRAIYLEIQAQTTWKQDGDPNEGDWANTLAAMSDDDAKRVAGLFVDLFEMTLGVRPPVAS
jgi:hypothetical protein